MKENLVIVRNTLYLCFSLGIVFLIIAALIYMPYKTILAATYQKMFNISIENYYLIWVCFIGLIKTILIFIFLVPALALQIITCKCKCKDID